MRVAELPGRPHFAIDIEKELASGSDLAIERTHRGLCIRRVVKDPVSDDQIEKAIAERRLHQIRLNNGAVRQIPRILERRKGRIGYVERVDFATALLGNKPGVEPGARPHLQHAVAIAIKGGQIRPILKAEFLAVPAHQEILMCRFEPI